MPEKNEKIQDKFLTYDDEYQVEQPDVEKGKSKQLIRHGS